MVLSNCQEEPGFGIWHHICCVIHVRSMCGPCVVTMPYAATISGWVNKQYLQVYLPSGWVNSHCVITFILSGQMFVVVFDVLCSHGFVWRHYKL